MAGAWGAQADYEAVNVSGTENVLAACRRAGVQRLVFKTLGEARHLALSLLGEVHVRRTGKAVFGGERGGAVAHQKDSRRHGDYRAASTGPILTAEHGCRHGDGVAVTP